jgi:hypothetical protein
MLPVGGDDIGPVEPVGPVGFPVDNALELHAASTIKMPTPRIGRASRPAQ